MLSKDKLYEIIFEADTREGKIFDIILLVVILLSVLTVFLESINSIFLKWGTLLKTIEWVITIFFTLEYFTRVIIINKPTKYIFSFYGIIDFLSFIPTYLAIFIAGAQSLVVIRAIRLLRVFRILKLNRYTEESKTIYLALKASKRKIGIFLYTVITLVIIIGTLIYLIEGAENGFTSIPKSIYWAIVTLTTVGYGDIAPQTALGQALASLVMIVGYAIIAVPTGIVTAEMTAMRNVEKTTQVCKQCLKEDHDVDAKHCKHCGEIMD